jgi:hypothetical protein
MSSMSLPRSVRELLDARRRAFLWTGKEKCHSFQCLVAWEHLCQSKGKGGLGIRSLELQNHCLLLKFVHKLHDPSTLPRKTWFLNQYGGVPAAFSDDSYIAGIVRKEIQRHRSLTIVRLGDSVRRCSGMIAGYSALLWQKLSRPFSHTPPSKTSSSLQRFTPPSPTNSAPGSQIVP